MLHGSGHSSPRITALNRAPRLAVTRAEDSNRRSRRSASHGSRSSTIHVPAGCRCSLRAPGRRTAACDLPNAETITMADTETESRHAACFTIGQDKAAWQSATSMSHRHPSAGRACGGSYSTERLHDCRRTAAPGPEQADNIRWVMKAGRIVRRRNERESGVSGPLVCATVGSAQ